MSDLSERALSIFAFAAYHSLESGQRVSGVTRRDGAGHEADPEGVSELASSGLAEADDGEIRFTEAGSRVLDAVIAAIRGAVR